jgi:hypothetical protein
VHALETDLDLAQALHPDGGRHQPEVQLAQPLVVHPARDLGEPEVQRGITPMAILPQVALIGNTQ